MVRAALAVVVVLWTSLVACYSDDGDVARRVASLLGNMTFEEKASMMNGVGYSESWAASQGFYVGNTAAIPRLGLPSLKMQDAGQGFRTTDPRMIGQVTAWSCALGLASTWDPALVKTWAEAAALQFKIKGANVILGPGVNVHRVPRGGRNVEYLSGEDGFLGAALAGPYVRGFQESGVLAVAKHFGFNNQETLRNQYSAKVTARAAFEVYYRPFQACVDAGVGAFMCAYNKVDGRYACGSKGLLAEDLKTAMGFKGFVMSDWGATHSVAVTEGLDQEMPGCGNYEHFYSPANLKANITAVDAAVSRILWPMVKYLTNSSCEIGGGCDHMLYEANATTPESEALALRIATESVLLLKNNNSVLPLINKTIGVVGSACAAPNDVEDLLKSWDIGSYYVVGGSGRVIPKSVVTVADGLGSAVTASSLTDDFTDALAVADRVDVVIACGGATTTESKDRDSLSLDQEAFLVELGRNVKKPLVVVALAPGAFLSPFAEFADAVLAIFLGGSATGAAVAKVLLGEHNPASKSPVTFPLTEDLLPCATTSCDYSEDLYVGYRGLHGKPVRWPFGHGLSFTTFYYAWGSAIQKRGRIISVTVRVTNTGRRAGADVAQLYVTYPPNYPDQPPNQLRAFNKTQTLKPRESQNLTLSLDMDDLRTWDDDKRAWVGVSGRVAFSVGASSRDIRLTIPGHDDNNNVVF